MKKRILAMTLALCMLLALVPGVHAAYFPDVVNHWARDSILAMADRGVVTGYPDGTYRPDAPISRVELLTLAVKTFEPASVPSTVLPADVAGDAWYAQTVRRALAAGYIPNAMIENNRLDPYRAATREEAAAVFAAAMALPASTRSLTYNDRAQISSWAVEAVARCSENGIFGGSTDGGFHPLDPIDRAQVAAVLYRAANYRPALITGVTGTEALMVGTASTLTVTTAPGVNYLQVRDADRRLLGSAAGGASSQWTVNITPVLSGAQTLYFFASESGEIPLYCDPVYSVNVNVGTVQVPALTGVQASTTQPVAGSTVTVTATTNNAVTGVELYDPSGVRVAAASSWTQSGSGRLWTLSFAVPAKAGSYVYTVGTCDAAGCDTSSSARSAKLTLTVRDTEKLPAIVSVKASDETPDVGDEVTVTVTTNKNASRVRLVDALGQTIAEKTSGYTTSGSSRVWKFTVKAQAAGVSWIRAYAASSAGGYTEDVCGSVTLTISAKQPAIRSVTASNYNPVVGYNVTITVTTDETVRRVKLTEGDKEVQSLTDYKTVGGQRVWTFECIVASAGQKNLRVYYGTGTSGYSSAYTALTLNATAAPAQNLSVSDIRVYPIDPTVGQTVTASITTNTSVTRLRIADVFGNSVTEVSGGYVDSSSGRHWTVSLTPTSAGAVQYFVFPGTRAGYSSNAAGFTVNVKAAPYRAVPAVHSVSADKSLIEAGDVVTLTVVTNAAAERVRLTDAAGTVITSTGSYTVSGSTRIWKLQARVLYNADYTGYVQAEGSGYTYDSCTPKTVTLKTRYSGSPVIYSVTDRSSGNFGIRRLEVCTSQNVGSVTVSTGAVAQSYKDEGVYRIWTVTWSPARGEATYVTVTAHGNGTANYSIHIG